MKVEILVKVCLLNVFIVRNIPVCCSFAVEMQKFLQAERNIIDSLKDYFQRQSKHGVQTDISTLKFVEYLDAENRKDNRIIDLSNPVSVFMVLKRAVNQWEDLSKNISCNTDIEQCPILTGSDVIETIKRKSSSVWPSISDLRFSALNILNIWNVYNISLDLLISGNIQIDGDVINFSNDTLSSNDIFYVADVAKDSGLVNEAIAWFEFLRSRLDRISKHDLKLSALYRRLAMSYYNIGIRTKAIELLEEFNKADPHDDGVSRDLTFIKSTNQVKDDIVEDVHFRSNKTEKRLRFEERCRNSLTVQSEQHIGLPVKRYCRLLPLYHWYGFCKSELISASPYIEVLYDMFSSDEADKLVKYGKNERAKYIEIRRAPDTVLFDNKIESKPLCERDPSFPLLQTLTTRLGLATRFQMEQVKNVFSSDCYKMLNLGPGIIDQPRVDYWHTGHQPFPYAGNRQASVMLQLSEVKYGGSLLFPRLNVTVPVIKGSAVLWENLKPDGLPDSRTVHQHCPVISGSHWVAVKHILYSNQIFSRPCAVRK